MSFNYLTDFSFLEKVLSYPENNQIVKITLLDWSERPIQDITGKVINGNFNLDGKSALRRTASLEIFLEDIEQNITNTQFLLSINKKIKVEIGIINKIKKPYKDDIIWFPLGLFVICGINFSHGLQGYTISLDLKDKMCLLNGEIAGVLPATTTINKISLNSGEENLNFFQMIMELVHHLGGEQIGKILISDIDSKIKQVVKWDAKDNISLYKYYFVYLENNTIKKTPYYCSTNIKDLEKIPIVNISVPIENIFNEDEKKEDLTKYPFCLYKKYKNNDLVGYTYTDFIYAQDLVGQAGESITSLLDKIKNILGNYEYFYDLNGNFIFREIKNYLNTSHSTLVLQEMKDKDYFLDLSRGKNFYNFKNSFLINNYNNIPQYDMIKNDFIVWGEREIDGLKMPIRYHLAIDKKPACRTHEVILVQEDKVTKAKGFRKIKNINEIKEKTSSTFYVINKDVYIWDDNKNALKKSDLKVTTITSKDWRTELYLQGVENEAWGLEPNSYYIELINEWPKIYNFWGEEKEIGFYGDPTSYEYFLDFIDSTAPIGEFSINNIGKRSKVVNEKDVHCLFPIEIPETVFILKDENNLSQEQKTFNTVEVSESIYDNLTIGYSSYSALESIQNLLYQYTGYNEQVSIQSLPLYFLDVNTRIGLNDAKTNIQGDYMIDKISFSLNLDSTMSISATRAIERI